MAVQRQRGIIGGNTAAINNQPKAATATATETATMTATTMTMETKATTENCRWVLCQCRKCRALAKLPPSSWLPRTSSHSAFATAIAFVSMVIIVAVIKEVSVAVVIAVAAFS